MTGDVEIRQAELADYDDVVAFASDTWSERREDGDYIPQVFEDWVASDGPRQRTLVADTGDDIAAIAQFVLLSEHEAWAQGMRTNPDYRGRGVGSTLVHEGFDWAREQGATVARNMVLWQQAVDNCYTTGATKSNHDRQDSSQHPGTGGNQVPVGRSA